MINNKYEDDIKRNLCSDKFFIEFDSNDSVYEEDCEEEFFKFDELRSCYVAFACISKKTLSSGQDNRPKIKSKPMGFPESEEKNTINGRLIFQRCHLLGYHLFKKKNDDDKENANLKRIFTGTRFMNNEMFYYEKKIADYVREDKNRKVYYRVTLYFEDENELAYGVQLEARFIDKNGKEVKDLSFNVFIYNKQPNICIKYKTGEILKDESIHLSEKMVNTDQEYVINQKSKRFHLKCCASVKYIDKESQCEFFGKRDELINGNKIGYKCRPCEICDSGAR